MLWKKGQIIANCGLLLSFLVWGASSSKTTRFFLRPFLTTSGELVEIFDIHIFCSSFCLFLFLSHFIVRFLGYNLPLFLFLIRFIVGDVVCHVDAQNFNWRLLNRLWPFILSGLGVICLTSYELQKKFRAKTNTIWCMTSTMPRYKKCCQKNPLIRTHHLLRHDDSVIRNSNFFNGLQTFPRCRERVKAVLRCIHWVEDIWWGTKSQEK